jgi:predicted HAD superfamily Cof-like phosphohydrolase
MINMINLQTVMHNHFGVQVPSSPKMLDKEHMKMRLNFLLEELLELAANSGFGLACNSEFAVGFTEDSTLEINPEEILDALVDLQVVLLGTVHLLGFFGQATMTQLPKSFIEKIPKGRMLVANTVELSIFEEAFNRVWQANMQKVPVTSAEESKRGFAIDLRKPDGWEKPDHSDLVADFVI